MSISLELPPSRRLLWKEMPNCQNGGLSAELWLPTGLDSSPCSLVIMFHGGSWCVGGALDVQPQQVNYLLDRGVAVVSLEYRLAPQVKLPDMDADCKQGYEWATTQLPDLVRDQATIDTSRGVGVIGASAGAHLSLLMIANVLKSSSAPKPAVALAFYPLTKSDDGSLGPVEAWEQHRAQKPEEVAYAEQVYKGEQIVSVPILNQPPALTPRRAFLGIAAAYDNLYSLMTDPSDPKSSRKVHSPFYLAGPDFPPTFLAWGSADPQIKPRQSRVFVERLKELGVECVGVELEGALHWWAEKDFVESRPGNEYWEKAIEPGLKFVIDKLDRSRA